MKLLVSDTGNKLKLGANNTLADKDCCCGPTLCPDVILVCDKASVTQIRCGFEPFNGSTAYTSVCGDPGSLFDRSVSTGDPADSNARFLTLDSFTNGCSSAGCDDCTDCCSSSGSSSYHADINPTDFTEPLTNGCHRDETSDDEVIGDDCDLPPETRPPCCDDGNFCVSGGATLSNEYTDGALFANAIAALPAYPDTWIGDCVAGSGFLDANHLQYAYAKIRYKFTTTIPRGCKLRIFWNETFVPNTPPFTPVTAAKSWTYDHGARSHTGGEPIAIGGDDGCALDDPLESDIYEILSADNVDGSYIITDIRWSFTIDEEAANYYVPPPGNPDIGGGAEGLVTYAFGPNCIEGSDNIHL